VLKKSVVKTKRHVPKMLEGLLSGEFLSAEKHEQLKELLQPMFSQYVNLGHAVVLAFLQTPSLFVEDNATTAVWKPEFIGYLDTLCADSDPEISVPAWAIEPPKPGKKKEKDQPIRSGGDDGRGNFRVGGRGGGRCGTRRDPGWQVGVGWEAVPMHERVPDQMEQTGWGDVDEVFDEDDY